MKDYKSHLNDHDYFTPEHLAGFLRNHKTGTDNVGRHYLGYIIRQTPNPNVLDVACGSAINHEVFRNMGIAHTYCGFDLTQGLLDEARKRYSGSIHLVKGHAQELDSHFELSSFDYVICRHFFEHVPNGAYEEIVKKALNIAKKELVIVFFLEPHSGPDHIIEERSSNIPDHPEVTHFWNQYSWGKLVEFFSTLGVQIKVETVRTPGAAHSDHIVRLIK